MSELWEWIVANWFGVVTAVAGVWISWRLRAHPALTMRVKGYNPRDQHSSQDFVLTLKNAGQERITAATFTRPLQVHVPATIISAHAERASQRDLTVGIVRRGERVLRIDPTLEPGDWVDIRVKSEPLDSSSSVLEGAPLRSEAELAGNRRGFVMRTSSPVTLALGWLLYGGLSSFAALLTVHALVTDPPLGLTFPILMTVTLILLEVVPALLWASGSYDAARELGGERFRSVTRAEFDLARTEMAGIVSMVALVLQLIVSLAYVTTIVVSGQSLPIASLVSWSLGIAVAAGLSIPLRSRVRTKSARWAAPVTSLIQLACVVGVGLTALGRFPDVVGLVLLGVLAVAGPALAALNRERGYAISPPPTQSPPPAQSPPPRTRRR